MRNPISIAWKSVLAVGALVLAACGSGGGGGTPVGTAALQGAVVLRDGTTNNLGGIRITDTRTGRTVTTGSNGSFVFGTVPAGVITLAVRDPLALVTAQSEGEDGTETEDGANHEAGDDHEDGENHDGDDDGDNHDVGDDDADEESVEHEDEVECEIEIEDGEISAIRFHHRDGDRARGEVRLTRAELSDDPDVTGSAELESRDDRQKLEVEAEHLTPGRMVEAFVVAADGAEATLGTAFANAEGEAEWELSTNDGDVLPFGAVTVADLVGLRVEVRDGNDGTVLLFGELPEIPTGTVGDGDGHDGDDGDGHDGDDSRGRTLLAAQGDAVGEAHVELRSCESERFNAELSGGTAGTVIEVWLANPANAGALEKVGEMTVDAEGEAELEMGHDGSALPFGAAHASDLVGLAVEFRATDGTVLFAGTTPALVTP